MKTILSALLVLVTTNLFSQSEVIGYVPSLTTGVQFIAELKYDIVGKDTIFTLTYENRKTTKVIDFYSFTITSNNAKDYIYNNMDSLYLAEYIDNCQMEFEVNKEKFIVASSKYIRSSTGKPIPMLVVGTTDGYFYLNKRQLHELFGK